MTICFPFHFLLKVKYPVKMPSSNILNEKHKITQETITSYRIYGLEYSLRT